MSCLASPPSITIPPGQFLAWAYATNFFYDPGVNPGNITAFTNASCGGITVVGGVPGSLGGNCYWTGFALPTLPQGAVIQDMKAVAVVTDQQGGGSVSTVAGPYMWTQPAPKPYTSVLDIGGSMGSNPNNIAGQTLAQLQFSVEAGASVAGTYGTFTGFDFAGIAIFFTAPPRKPIQTWINIGNTVGPR